MEVLDNIKQSVTLLKEVDDYQKELLGEDGLLSVCDRKVDYWLHYLEFEDIKVTQAYNILREIRKQRLLRRKYKNDADLIKTYKDNEAKMQNASNRDLMLVQIHKTDTRHKNAKYCYNAYTDEERDAILGVKKDGLFSKIMSFKKGDTDGEG